MKIAKILLTVVLIMVFLAESAGVGYLSRAQSRDALRPMASSVSKTGLPNEHKVSLMEYIKAKISASREFLIQIKGEGEKMSLLSAAKELSIFFESFISTADVVIENTKNHMAEMEKSDKILYQLNLLSGHFKILLGFLQYATFNLGCFKAEGNPFYIAEKKRIIIVICGVMKNFIRRMEEGIYIDRKVIADYDMAELTSRQRKKMIRLWTDYLDLLIKVISLSEDLDIILKYWENVTVPNADISEKQLNLNYVNTVIASAG